MAGSFVKAGAGVVELEGGIVVVAVVRLAPLDVGGREDAHEEVGRAESLQ